MTSQQASFGLQDASKTTPTEEYVFQPGEQSIKGYPTLWWGGKRPFISTQHYPAQLKEMHGPAVDGWRSKIYWGDNLQVMSHLLKQFRGQIRLVYIDPPFDSKAEYKKTIKLRGATVQNDHGAFEDKQYTDIWTNDGYLQYMYERLTILRELLADNGSIYLHCDWRVVSYLKIMLEEIMGNSSVRNVICWKSSPGHTDAALYGQMQNTIIFAAKGSNPVWNQQYQPYDEEYLAAHYQTTDSDGRRFENADLTAYGLKGGGYLYEWHGITKLWRCPITTMRQYEKEGRLYYTKNGVARYKRYIDEMPGSPLSDLWLDIPRLNSQALEKEGYPTQKPEALIERIVMASSNPDDIVFDCFMGSGTTQAVAMKLGRRFIGADINLGAVQITTKRLIRIAQEIEVMPKAQQTTLLPPSEEDRPPEPSVFYTGFEVYNVNHYDIFRNPVEAKDLLLQALEINPLEAGHLFDGEKDGRLWKIMPVNRIATRQDLNELITGLDYRAFDRRQAEHPHQPVEKITLVCMGHEPDLAAVLAKEVEPYKLDVQVVDILRDKQDLQFKREAEARIAIQDGHLVIDRFYPMNLLQKLSLQAEAVDDWRELVESVMIDWNYDGAVFQPAVVDIPEKEELVSGRYPIPADAGTIRVKITDLLSESLEQEVSYG